MSLLDIGDALLELLEPGGTIAGAVRTADSGLVVDHTGVQPVVYEPQHVYAWPAADDHRPDNGLQIRQVFELLVVYVFELTDEEPRQERRREVTEALNAKRDDWLQLIEHNRTMDDDAQRPLWSNLEARAEFDYVRALGVRGVAVRALGYRLLVD